MKTLKIRLDACLFERRLECSNITSRPPPTKSKSRPFTWSIPPANPTPTSAPAPPPPSTPKPSVSPSQSADGTVPMEIDASGIWHLMEAKESRCRTLGLCGYCGEKGHPIQACPVAPPLWSNHRPGHQNRRIMTVEVSQPEAEKDDTQE